MITIREVAGESGFSVTTVSMVLNNGTGVARISERTRNRIWEVARPVGYRPNLHARWLRSNRSEIPGVMVFDLTNSIAPRSCAASKTTSVRPDFLHRDRLAG